MKLILMIAATLFTLSPTSAQSAEADYQKVWCGAAGGQTELTLEDRSRVDCLTESHAIEFDFGRKWGESVGQALNYAMYTGRRAGVVLILEKDNDTERRYVQRVVRMKCHYGLPLDVWVIKSLNPADIVWDRIECDFK